MSLPHATQAQINAMQKEAEKKMRQDGVVMEETITQPVEQKHPMLAHHEEPSMQIETEAPDLHEVEEYDDSVEEVIQEQPKETPQQMNFRRMREELEQAKRDRDEAMRYAMSSQKPQQQQYAQPEPEDDYSDIGLDDDGLAEGKHIKKVLKEMREIKKELNHYKQKSTEDTTKIKLATQFPDYDKVMTSENLSRLEAANPELAEMIMNTTDRYKQSKLAYDMVKQYGIYSDAPKAPTYDNEKAIAQKNAAKPRPLASVSPQQGDSPLSKANAFANGSLSKDMKEQFRREMIEATRGR